MKNKKLQNIKINNIQKKKKKKQINKILFENKQKMKNSKNTLRILKLSKLKQDDKRIKSSKNHIKKGIIRNFRNKQNFRNH